MDNCQCLVGLAIAKHSYTRSFHTHHSSFPHNQRGNSSSIRHTCRAGPGVASVLDESNHPENNTTQVDGPPECGVPRRESRRSKRLTAGPALPRVSCDYERLLEFPCSHIQCYACYPSLILRFVILLFDSFGTLLLDYLRSY